MFALLFVFCRCRALLYVRLLSEMVEHWSMARGMITKRSACYGEARYLHGCFQHRSPCRVIEKINYFCNFLSLYVLAGRCFMNGCLAKWYNIGQWPEE